MACTGQEQMTTGENWKSWKDSNGKGNADIRKDLKKTEDTVTMKTPIGDSKELNWHCRKWSSITWWKNWIPSRIKKKMSRDQRDDQCVLLENVASTWMGTVIKGMIRENIYRSPRCRCSGQRGSGCSGCVAGLVEDHSRGPLPSQEISLQIWVCNPLDGCNLET